MKNILRRLVAYSTTINKNNDMDIINKYSSLNSIDFWGLWLKSIDLEEKDDLLLNTIKNKLLKSNLDDLLDSKSWNIYDIIKSFLVRQIDSIKYLPLNKDLFNKFMSNYSVMESRYRLPDDFRTDIIGPIISEGLEKTEDDLIEEDLEIEKDLKDPKNLDKNPYLSDYYNLLIDLYTDYNHVEDVNKGLNILKDKLGTIVNNDYIPNVATMKTWSPWLRLSNQKYTPANVIAIQKYIKNLKTLDVNYDDIYGNLKSGIVVTINNIKAYRKALMESLKYNGKLSNISSEYALLDAQYLMLNNLSEVGHLVDINFVINSILNSMLKFTDRKLIKIGIDLALDFGVYNQKFYEHADSLVNYRPKDDVDNTIDIKKDENKEIEDVKLDSLINNKTEDLRYKEGKFVYLNPVVDINDNNIYEKAIENNDISVASVIVNKYAALFGAFVTTSEYIRVGSGCKRYDETFSNTKSDFAIYLDAENFQKFIANQSESDIVLKDGYVVLNSLNIRYFNNPDVGLYVINLYEPKSIGMHTAYSKCEVDINPIISFSLVPALYLLGNLVPLSLRFSTTPNEELDDFHLTTDAVKNLASRLNKGGHNVQLNKATVETVNEKLVSAFVLKTEQRETVPLTRSIKNTTFVGSLSGVQYQTESETKVKLASSTETHTFLDKVLTTVKETATKPIVSKFNFNFTTLDSLYEDKGKEEILKEGAYHSVFGKVYVGEDLEAVKNNKITTMVKQPNTVYNPQLYLAKDENTFQIAVINGFDNPVSFPVNIKAYYYEDNKLRYYDIETKYLNLKAREQYTFNSIVFKATPNIVFCIKAEPETTLDKLVLSRKYILPRTSEQKPKFKDADRDFGEKPITIDTNNHISEEERIGNMIGKKEHRSKVELNYDDFYSLFSDTEAKMNRIL